MRTKALVIGARFPFEGPWITLEEGEWVIAGDTDYTAVIHTICGKVLEDFPIKISGPTKVRVMIKRDNGGDLYLNAEQVR